MTLRFAATLALLLLSVPLAARQHIVAHRDDELPAIDSMMWIAAHPDDEVVVAPLLSYWCREQNVACTMLIVTRGDAGPCLRADGCDPDVASVRSAEAGAASQYFHANLILLTERDHGVRATESLIARLANLIDAIDPDLVLTFDPRHGTTCHPDHRAIGQTVFGAVARLSDPPVLYLLETKLAFTANPFIIRFDSATPASFRFDANARWSAVIDDMRRHPSQFDQAWIDAVASVPPNERNVFLAPASILTQGASECR